MSEQPQSMEKIKVDKDRIATTGSKLEVRLVSDRKVPLTHEKCYEHLSLDRFDEERDISERHVQRLYDEMIAGRFLWDDIILKTATIHRAGKKIKYQINGQHTCWARLNLPQGNDPRVLYREYDVDTDEQLRRLYSVVDVGRPRGQGHLLKVLLCGQREFEGVWPSLAGSLAAGFKLWKFENKEESRRRGPNDIAADIAKNYPELFSQVAEYAPKSYSTQPHTRRAAVYAALFATYDARPSLVKEFWEPVADGLGLANKNDPRYVLRELLMKVQTDRSRSAVSVQGIGGGRLAQRRIMSSEEIYRVCINGWNKWRINEPAKDLRPTARRVMPK